YRTALHIASENGHSEVVKELIAAGAKVDVQDNGMKDEAYKAPHNIINAILAEDTADGWVLENPADDIRRMIRALKRAAPDPESDEPRGAAQSRQIFGFVRTVGGYGADVQLLDGWTALHIASSYGYSEVVKELIAAGAKVDVQDNGMKDEAYKAPHNIINAILAEDTADGWVLENPADDIRRMIRALKRAAPDPESDEPRGAAQSRQIFGFVRTVGGYGADVQLLDGWTALHIASSYGYSEVVKELIAAGAKVVQDNGMFYDAKNVFLFMWVL
ncbi:putative ankyrin repeat protein R873, partial [Diplonema papillatum]